MITPQDIADVCNDQGLDNKDKFTAFIQTALLQVKVNSLNVQLQRVAQKQSEDTAANTTSRESIQTQISTTQAQLLALISAQS